MNERKPVCSLLRGPMIEHSLYPKQSHHPNQLYSICSILRLGRREQLAVKAAETVVEELTLDWVRVDL